MNKFYIISTSLVIFFILQIGYLTTHNKNLSPLLEFINFTSFPNPAFYSNIYFLRHKDLNNIDIIFSLHPSLKENALGSFVLKSPIK